MHSSALLLSVKPEYAKKILDGQKKFELRKVRPKLTPNDLIILYVSSPEKALKAILQVEEVLIDDPDKLWEKILDEVGISREEYDSYFGEASIGFAIRIKKVYKLDSPFSLSEIRGTIPRFHPPQIYQYFSGEKLRQLIEAMKLPSPFEILFV